jgi:F-type H+-transporting ATPase subunit b
MDFAENIRSFVEDALGITDGVFGVNATEMGIQIVSTILLFLVVRYFFWNKVTEYLEGRKEAMKNEYDEAKQANTDAILINEKAAKELNDIRLSAKDIVDEARVRGEENRKNIIVKAKDDANKLIDDAHKEINSQIEKARNNINDEIVSVATLMAEKIIKKELDEDKYKELIEEVTKEVTS